MRAPNLIVAPPPEKPLTLYSIDTHFDASTTDSFLKTLWEKKKLLVTSNFFFSHNIFY